MSATGSGPNQKELRYRWLTIVGMVVLMAIFVATMFVIQRSRLALVGVWLHVVTALNIILMLVLLFVLGRNIIKLYVERRRQKLGSQFTTRVVVTYIGMALVPTVLLFIAASGLIQRAIDTWFSPETTQIVTGARAVSHEALIEKETQLMAPARLLADEITEDRALGRDSWIYLREKILAPRREQLLLDAILVYEGNSLLLEPYFDPESEYADVLGRSQLPVPDGLEIADEETGGEETAESASPVPPLPEDHPLFISQAQLALALQGEQPFREQRTLTGGGRMLLVGVPIFTPSGNDAVGVVVVGQIVSDTLDAQVAYIDGLYNSFMAGLDQKEPIQRTYLLTFLLMTLLILFSALWVGLYLARGVTGPIQKLAEGTRAVASGDLGYQVEVEARDELGTLVESFNEMTLDLHTHQEKLQQSRNSLQRTNTELDERRRYMEAVLANIATGVISLNAEGQITTFNRAAERMLSLEEDDAVGQPFEQVLNDSSFDDLRLLIDRAKSRRSPLEDDLALDVNGSRLTVAAHCSSLRDSAGAYMGTVVVLDDLTQLIKAQKTAAWREVARRIAHEIRNPLTPIQLSAQRIARRYRRAAGAEGHFDVIEEGTRTILQEVNTLKGLVSEFSRYARMPTVSLVPANLHDIIENSLLACASMHNGIRVERHFADDVPTIKADPDQLKRTFTNLFDNAVEAMEGEGELQVKTAFDPEIEMVRIEISDTGAGIKAEDKERLFLPYFSRKRDGTGLGLAIVHQIVADHSGYVRVADNRPHGTVFIIELPR